MFASANFGNFAFVAGGLSMGTSKEIYNLDSKLWDHIPRMNPEEEAKLFLELLL